jgi:hypothetical protein
MACGTARADACGARHHPGREPGRPYIGHVPAAPPRTPLELTLLPGARELLGAHAAELPQRDDLCGAFCGALALRAAGVQDVDGEPLDQDAVARAAGSVVSPPGAAGHLPLGELGRRDYRLAPPTVDDPALSGTTVAGLLDGIGALAAGRLAAIPYAAPWSAATLAGIFDAAAALEQPVTLIANLATRHLWGGRPGVEQVFAYLLDGNGPPDDSPGGLPLGSRAGERLAGLPHGPPPGLLDGPPPGPPDGPPPGLLDGPPPGPADSMSPGPPDGPAPDWDVGHFVCVAGRVRGPGGSLYLVADTYPALGRAGVHLQPERRLAAAIARPDMPAGGVIAVVAKHDAPALRAAAAALGLVEGAWDNGTLAPEAAR